MTQNSLLSSQRVKRWCAILAMAAAYLHAAWFSWGKWGELLIDSGMDLEDAAMLQQKGRLLYVDPLYPYGPLVPYFHALLFRIFGVNSGVICAAGLVCAALMTMVLYRMGRLFIGRIGSAAAAIAFIYCCAFAQLTPNGIFNFVLSYRACAQDGALIAAAGTLFLIRHAQKGRAKDFLIAAFLLALAALTKIESVVAVASAHLAFAVGQLWTKRFDAKLYLGGYGAAGLMAMGIYGIFYLYAGRSLFEDNILQLAVHGNYQHYAKTVMGTDDLADSLNKAATSLFLFALVCVPIVVLARVLKPGVKPARRTDGRWGFTCALIGLSVYFVQPLEASLDTAFRFVPFVAVGLLLLLVRFSYGDLRQRIAALPQAILWSLVLGSLCRMLFRTISYHYGFYLLPPAFVAIAVFFFRTLPDQFPKQPRLRMFSGYACVGMYTALSINHHLRTGMLYALRTERIATARGEITIRHSENFVAQGKVVSFPTGEYWRQVVEFLQALPRDSKVMIVPHGQSGLTFFSGLEDPYKDYVTPAPTLHGRFDDDEFVQKVKDVPPDYIIKSRLDVSEYGQTEFGDSYSQKTWAYLKERYEEFKVLGPRYIVIYRRKG